MSRRTALYRCFDAADVLLYVGITGNFGTRWQQHAFSKAWWPEVQWQTVDWYPSWAPARKAEVQAIRTECPLHNIAETPLAFRPTRPQAPVAQFDILMGTYEISELLGVSRQRVLQIASDATFPDPCEVLAAGKIWPTADIVAWAQAHGRLLADEGEAETTSRSDSST